MIIEDAVDSLWKFLEKHKSLGLCAVGVNDGIALSGREIYVTVRAPIPQFLTEISEWEGFKVHILRKVG